MQELLAAVGPNAKRGIRSQITIHKAAIKKGKLVADFSETLDNEQAGRDFSVTCGDDAHPDLLAAFQALVPDFCDLNDQLPIDPEDCDHVQELALFAVTGITYKGDFAIPSFVLTGTRELAAGYTLNLVAPLLSGADVGERVLLLLAALNAEVELGLRGKCAEAGRQLDMFQGEELSDDELRIRVLGPEVGQMAMDDE